MEENGTPASLIGRVKISTRIVEFSLKVSNNHNLEHKFAEHTIIIVGDGRTFASDEIPIQHDVIRLLRRQHLSHENKAFSVLFRTPIIPWILPEMKVAEDAQFKGAVWVECQSRFIGIWVEWVGIPCERRVVFLPNGL